MTRRSSDAGASVTPRGNESDGTGVTPPTSTFAPTVTTDSPVHALAPSRAMSIRWGFEHDASKNENDARLRAPSGPRSVGPSDPRRETRPLMRALCYRRLRPPGLMIMRELRTCWGPSRCRSPSTTTSLQDWRNSRCHGCLPPPQVRRRSAHEPTDRLVVSCSPAYSAPRPAMPMNIASHSSRSRCERNSANAEIRFWVEPPPSRPALRQRRQGHVRTASPIDVGSSANSQRQGA